MRYDFVKVFYKKIGDMNFNQYQETAYEMIQYGKKKLGNGQFSKYFYNSIINIIDLVNKKYGGNDVFSSDATELKEELRCKKEIKKEQCVFLTFLIMEIQKEEMEKEGRQTVKEHYCSDGYKRKYVSILNEFYRANGLETLINCSMDNAILYFVLATRQSWKTWVDMRAEWNGYRQNDQEWHRKHSEWRYLTYSEFKEMVEKGLSKNSAQTQNTYLEADRAIEEIINDYNKEKWQKDNRNNHNEEKHTEDMKEPKVSDVFPADVQKVMENAEWRRTWYLYRMICMGIESQIETIIQNARTVKAFHYKMDEDRLKAAIDKCWLHTNYVEMQSKISSAADEKKMEEALYAYFNSCVLTAENIVHIFNETLGGYGKVVFVQAKYRFICHFSELTEEYLNDPKRRIHRAFIREYFKSDKEIEEIWDSGLTGSERNAYLLCKVMSGETITSKELLLLTALIIKKQGCQEINRDYVQNHVLKNCRFAVKLNPKNIFEKFFEDTFFDINKLYENAQKLEREMLEMGRGAVFYNIIRGKEV